MPEQLTFDLPVRTSLERGDFFVSDANALAVARLEATADWTNSKLALIGPEGAGKTHLAHVWADAQAGRVIALGDITAAEVVGVKQPLAVETPAEWSVQAEQVAFHLHNHMGAQGLPLLLIARTAPARWNITLPDLKSRMEATDVVQIEAPDDMLLMAVLVKLFDDRQLRVKPNLIEWLAKRIDRSFAEANRVVALLDETALTSGGAISRKLAGQVLNT